MPKCFSMVLRVLGYREDGECIAHCLEMDIVAEGENFDEACANLWELIEMQVSFAYFKDQYELLNHPAPPVYFQVFDQVNQRKISTYSEDLAEGDYYTTNMPIPKPSKRAFEEVHA